MNRRISVLLLVAFIALPIASCAGRAKRTEAFMGALRTYNEGLRWQRYNRAASHIAPASRDAFLDERAELEEELRIDDWELMRVRYESGKKGPRQRAHVRIRYTWHLDRQGVVHVTSTRQLWERRGPHWVMAEEFRARGEEMPGVAEPQEPPHTPVTRR